MTTVHVFAPGVSTFYWLSSIDEIIFNSPPGYMYMYAEFTSNQFARTVSVAFDPGNTGNHQEIIIGLTSTYFSAANWTIANWRPGDLITLNGTDHADLIFGPPTAAHFHGGGGVDTLVGGPGNDIFEYDGSEFSAGGRVDGGGGLDLLLLTGGLFGLYLMEITNIESLELDGLVTARLRGDQFGSGHITEFRSAGTSEVEVSGQVINLAGTHFAGWDDSDHINLLGTRAAGSILIGSTENDNIMGATGGPGHATGRDYMAGRGGDDVYTVDQPFDQVDESLPGSSGHDVVRSRVSFNLSSPQATGAVEDLWLLGGADLSGIGNGLANVITGTVGSNTLAGGGGNDRLLGGAGNDRFRFDTALSSSGNVDHIGDFSHLADAILLSHAVFSGVALGTLAAGAFRLGTAAADAGDHIIYDRPTGRLWYDPDGTGAQAKVLFAVLDNHAVLGSTDFVVTA